MKVNNVIIYIEGKMDNLNLGMFKAYDIRTKSGNLTEDIIEKLLKAIVKYYKDYLKVDSVVICRDARLSAPSLMEKLVDKFLQVGLEVFCNPLQSGTCTFYYSCMQHLTSGGIMITASHNPGEYIGFKFVGKACSPIATGSGPFEGITKIKELYLSEDIKFVKSQRAQVHIIDDSNSYVDYSMKLAGVEHNSLKGCKIFVDFLSGAMGSVFMSAFEKAGAIIHAKHFVPDGHFYYGDPNPIIESSVAEAKRLIQEGDYDFGFCFDGDGDRMDLLSPTGEQIVPGFNMAILIPEIKKLFQPVFLNNFDPKVYADVKAIPTAIAEIAKAKIDVHIIRNGHSFIKLKLQENFTNQYLAAEEESAHYYMNFPVSATSWEKGVVATENTLYFALLTAKMWKNNPNAYKMDLVKQKSIFRYREWPLHFDQHPDKMEEIMAEVEKTMADRGALIIKDMDDGSVLDATLMRFNLPCVIESTTQLNKEWVQVAQRISRSEDAMTRWEVVSSKESLCESFNSIVKEIADRYVKEGFAYY